MGEYIFIYKDSYDKWCTTTDLELIAMHKRCRAIKTTEILSKFKSVQAFLNSANDYFNNENTEDFIGGTALREIK